MNAEERKEWRRNQVVQFVGDLDRLLGELESLGQNWTGEIATLLICQHDKDEIVVEQHNQNSERCTRAAKAAQDAFRESLGASDPPTGNL
jgi:hypothetical protein